jgi:hypothetical protein
VNFGATLKGNDLLEFRQLLQYPFILHLAQIHSPAAVIIYHQSRLLSFNAYFWIRQWNWMIYIIWHCQVNLFLCFWTVLFLKRQLCFAVLFLVVSWHSLGGDIVRRRRSWRIIFNDDAISLTADYICFAQRIMTAHEIKNSWRLTKSKDIFWGIWILLNSERGDIFVITELFVIYNFWYAWYNKHASVGRFRAEYGLNTDWIKPSSKVIYPRFFIYLYGLVFYFGPFRIQEYQINYQ